MRQGQGLIPGMAAMAGVSHKGQVHVTCLLQATATAAVAGHAADRRAMERKLPAGMARTAYLAQAGVVVMESAAST